MVLSSLGGEPLVLIKEFNFHQKDRSPCVYVIGLKKGQPHTIQPHLDWLSMAATVYEELPAVLNHAGCVLRLEGCGMSLLAMNRGMTHQPRVLPFYPIRY
jgi:hypothetical protein